MTGDEAQRITRIQKNYGTYKKKKKKKLGELCDL